MIEMNKPGDLFGHFSFFTSQPRETDCECASATHLIACSQEDFLAVAKDFPKDYVICYLFCIGNNLPASCFPQKRRNSAM